MNFSTLLSTALGTTRDINQIASVSEQLQSPQVQAEIQEVKSLAETYATVTLALQAITTIAIVGTFFLALQHKGKR